MDEITRASGTESRARAWELLQGVRKRAAAAFGAIEVAELPDGKYVFQLKPEYSHVTRRYASKPFMSRATQKTLSYIALEQPVSSRQLVETRGSGVYAHLRELRNLDVISHQSVGRLKIYSTTDKFQEYFGIKGDQETLKQMLFKKVRRVAAGAAAAPAG